MQGDRQLISDAWPRSWNSDKDNQGSHRIKQYSYHGELSWTTLSPDVQEAVPDPQYQDRDDGVQRRNHLIHTFNRRSTIVLFSQYLIYHIEVLG